MKKLFGLFFCVLIGLICVVVYVVKPYYSPAERQGTIPVRCHHDDTIRVGYIGDSWADRHSSTNCIIAELLSLSLSRPAQVRTAGISGITSKNIYYSIFRDDSVRHVIEWGPDFCFVVAGINDSDRKMGKRYYKDNMRLIIELLLENQIIPVVLEIPTYDIHFSFKRRNWQIKLQYLTSMLLTWSKMDCILDYREAYTDLIEEHGWREKVISILAEDWNPDGYKDKRCLYDGGLMHLNTRGYYVLDSCISQKITEYIKGSSNSENH